MAPGGGRPRGVRAPVPPRPGGTGSHKFTPPAARGINVSSAARFMSAALAREAGKTSLCTQTARGRDGGRGHAGARLVAGRAPTGGARTVLPPTRTPLWGGGCRAPCPQGTSWLRGPGPLHRETEAGRTSLGDAGCPGAGNGAGPVASILPGGNTPPSSEHTPDTMLRAFRETMQADPSRSCRHAGDGHAHHPHPQHPGWRAGFQAHQHQPQLPAGTSAGSAAAARDTGGPRDARGHSEGSWGARGRLGGLRGLPTASLQTDQASGMSRSKAACGVHNPHCPQTM